MISWLKRQKQMEVFDPLTKEWRLPITTLPSIIHRSFKCLFLINLLQISFERKYKFCCPGGMNNLPPLSPRREIEILACRERERESSRALGGIKKTPPGHSWERALFELKSQSIKGKWYGNVFVSRASRPVSSSPSQHSSPARALSSF